MKINIYMRGKQISRLKTHGEEGAEQIRDSEDNARDIGTFAHGGKTVLVCTYEYNKSHDKDT
jgi:hypothetical protein